MPSRLLKRYGKWLANYAAFAIVIPLALMGVAIGTYWFGNISFSTEWSLIWSFVVVIPIGFLGGLAWVWRHNGQDVDEN